MEIHVDFDLILIAIFITIFITGYIRGAGIELLRVLKVVIPFFILYFYGDTITKKLFSSHNIVNFVYTILPNIPYKNTIAALSTQICLYIVVYAFLAIFLWRLGKYILDERIEYFFGRTNSIFGGIFSVVRMYIIISIFIIPFYALNFTNYNDFLTSFVLDHPPHFSRLGLLIDKSKPTVDKLNEVSQSLKIMDFASLQKYAGLITDVKKFINQNEEDANTIYLYMRKEGLITDEYNQTEFLHYYITHLDDFKKFEAKDQEINTLNEKLIQNVQAYSNVFNWAYENQIQNMQNDDEMIQSFVDNYPYISADYHDQLTLEVLENIKLKTQVYLIIKSWIQDSYQLNLTNDTEILNDDVLKLILDDFAPHKDDLIQRINNMNAKDYEKEDIIAQINRFASFQEDYIKTYKPQIELYDHLLTNVSFKYKLAFSIMKEKDLSTVYEEHIDHDPLLYFFMIDSLKVLDHMSDENHEVNYEAGQIYVALFLINIHLNQGNQIQIDPIRYEDLLTTVNRFQSNKDVFNKTKKDVNEVFNTLLVEREGQSYFEYLILNHYAEPTLIDDMLTSSQVKSFLTFDNYQRLQRIDEKLNEEMR